MKAAKYNNFGKRLFDLGMVLLCLAVRIRAKLRNPIFFHQTRLILHGRPFQLLKFRTMHDAVDAQGSPLPDAKRLTPFGRWLRATSLDKLLEFSGVLHAFVGQPVFLVITDRHSEQATTCLGQEKWKVAMVNRLCK